TLLGDSGSPSSVFRRTAYARAHPPCPPLRKGGKGEGARPSFSPPCEWRLSFSAPCEGGVGRGERQRPSRVPKPGGNRSTCRSADRAAVCTRCAGPIAQA